VTTSIRAACECWWVNELCLVTRVTVGLIHGFLLLKYYPLPFSSFMELSFITHIPTCECGNESNQTASRWSCASPHSVTFGCRAALHQQGVSTELGPKLWVCRMDSCPCFPGFGYLFREQLDPDLGFSLEPPVLCAAFNSLTFWYFLILWEPVEHQL